jgi:hypothetical protein
MRMPLVRTTLPLALVLAAAACARPASTTTSEPTPAPAPAASAAAATPGPSAADLRRDLFAFADDSMRGRETGTPDADRAARFIVERLVPLGLEPAGDSGFYQRVPMLRTSLVATEISAATPSGKTALALGRDITVLPTLGAGAPLPKLDADADIVFAGYGIVDPVLKRNDLEGLSVGGKTVVVVNDAPAGLDSATRAKYHGINGFAARLQLLAMRQPAAVILLMPDSMYEETAGELSTLKVQLATGNTNAARVLTMIAIAPIRAGSPFVPASWPASTAPVASTGSRFVAHIQERREPFNGYNVVAVARGSDPARRGTYVAFGAHYDHIGIQPPVNGDSIANGADDDGSGSMTLLGIARSWKAGPAPRRSALFVWHIGEEEGLLGSQWFTDHPTVPIDSIVAQINADMIGRNGPDSLYIVGPAAAPNGQSRVMGTIVDSVNAALAHPFTFDRTWDTPTHPERIYYRSDHYNYARKGIPIVYFTTGLHPQYHKVTDEPQLIEYDKMARVGTLMYHVGLAVANRATRPK